MMILERGGGGRDELLVVMGGKRRGEIANLEVWPPDDYGWMWRLTTKLKSVSKSCSIYSSDVLSGNKKWQVKISCPFLAWSHFPVEHLVMNQSTVQVYGSVV